MSETELQFSPQGPMLESHMPAGEPGKVPNLPSNPALSARSLSLGKVKVACPDTVTYRNGSQKHMAALRRHAAASKSPSRRW